jgi:hypothetical protein
MFNLNTSTKPEVSLNKSMITELINIYGVRSKFLNSKRIAEDFTFKDFAGFEVDDGFNEEFIDITLLPEERASFEGSTEYNSFGFYNQQYVTFYISSDDVEKITEKNNQELQHLNTREIMTNSLIVMPSSVILEVTEFSKYTEGISNLWGYADYTQAYKMTCKVYTASQVDDTNFDTEIDLSEGPDGSRDKGKIHEKVQDVNSNIDDFFESLVLEKEQQNEESRDIVQHPNTANPFGTLG